MHTLNNLFFSPSEKTNKILLRSTYCFVAVSLSRSCLPFFLTKLPSVGGEGNVDESITPEVTVRLSGHNTVTCVDSDLYGQWSVWTVA